MLLAQLLTKAGALKVPEWFEAGKVAQESSWAPFGTLLVIQFFLFGWVEGKRWMDIINHATWSSGKTDWIWVDPWNIRVTGEP